MVVVVVEPGVGRLVLRARGPVQRLLEQGVAGLNRAHVLLGDDVAAEPRPGIAKRHEVEEDKKDLAAKKGRAPPAPPAGSPHSC